MSENGNQKCYWAEQTNNIIRNLAPLEYQLESVAGVDFAKIRYDRGRFTVEVQYDNWERETFDFTDDLQKLYNHSLWPAKLTNKIQDAIFEASCHQKEKRDLRIREGKKLFINTLMEHLNTQGSELCIADELPDLIEETPSEILQSSILNGIMSKEIPIVSIVSLGDNSSKYKMVFSYQGKLYDTTLDVIEDTLIYVQAASQIAKQVEKEKRENFDLER